MIYDIILQNNASKAFYLLTKQEDIAVTELYLHFENVDLDAPDGEYVYACFANDRDDVTYEFKTPILDTIVKADGKEILLRDIQPYTGLLRIGKIEDINLYNEEDVTYQYDDNNEIIYYEG